MVLFKTMLILNCEILKTTTYTSSMMKGKTGHFYNYLMLDAPMYLLPLSMQLVCLLVNLELQPLIPLRYFLNFKSSSSNAFYLLSNFYFSCHQQILKSFTCTYKTSTPIIPRINEYPEATPFILFYFPYLLVQNGKPNVPIG